METKHYLASANSAQGFINLFDNINTSENGFTYILKGGPGTGKSSFMKKIGAHFEKKQYDVEYFYCSSDQKSLDGVRIKNISIIDGTAPHSFDATLPQIKQKIINLGEFIKDEIKKYRKNIELLLQQKTECYKKLYLYLSALNCIIKTECDEKIITNKRKLFCSYFCDEKIKNLYEKNNFENVKVLSGNYINNKEYFKTLLSKEKDVLCFASVFNPEMLDGIYVESLKTLFVCEDALNNSTKSFKNKKIIDLIISKVAFYLKRAKSYHMKIEKYFVKNMDFETLGKFTKKFIKQIEVALK